MSNILIKQVVKRYKKGEIIFKQNSAGNEMYIIDSGKVQIYRRADGKKVVLEVLGNKCFFGEMALFSDNKRTATAVTLEDAKLIVITKEMLTLQLKNVPQWFVTMFRALVERLEKANKRIDN